MERTRILSKKNGGCKCQFWDALTESALKMAWHWNWCNVGCINPLTNQKKEKETVGFFYEFCSLAIKVFLWKFAYHLLILLILNFYFKFLLLISLFEVFMLFDIGKVKVLVWNIACTFVMVGWPTILRVGLADSHAWDGFHYSSYCLGANWQCNKIQAIS
jgi:hypothetical protein